MATLAQILALLPDNTTGDIGADDVRAAVTELWHRTDGSIPIEGVTFDVTEVGAPTEPGALRWNAEHDALEVVMADPEVLLSIGQMNLIRARNTSGATIPNGAPVQFVGGATNNRPEMAPDDGQGRIIGLVTHNVPNNTEGLISTSGLVYNVNTAAFSEGSGVFVGASGNFTNTEGTASFAGIVTASDATEGIILALPRAYLSLSGESSTRPVTAGIGLYYFDTTLNIPIWWTGTTWVDATGAPA
jgi:hypothetical protein